LVQPEAPDFLFLGTHDGIVDSAGRLNIPADFRRALEECGEDQLVFAPGTGPGRFILAIPRKVYSVYWRSADPSNASFTLEESLDPDLATHAKSFRKYIDNQGRLTLPQAIFEWSQMQRDIVFVGRRNHFIIWDKAAYEAHNKDQGITPGEAWKRYREIQERMKESSDADVRRDS
jgi:MraZ protein